MSKQPNQPAESSAESVLAARRALAGAGITRLEQLTQVTEAELKKLHGLGPNGIDQLRRALADHGWSFKSGLRRCGVPNVKDRAKRRFALACEE